MRIFCSHRDNFILDAEIQIHIYWYAYNVLFNKYTLKTKLKKLEEILKHGSRRPNVCSYLKKWHLQGGNDKMEHTKRVNDDTPENIYYS